MKVYIWSFFLGLVSILSQAQPAENLKVGEKCPDFTLLDVHHPPSKNVRLADFAGKWLIVDFWNKACVICPRSFPKLSELQEIFRDSVHFLLIGINNTRFNAGIEGFYEKLRLRDNLQLSIAYDSVAKNALGVRTVPHILVVDPKGVIRAVTLPDELNEEVLRSFLSGKNPPIKQKTD